MMDYERVFRHWCFAYRTGKTEELDSIIVSFIFILYLLNELDVGYLARLKAMSAACVYKITLKDSLQKD